MHKPAVRTISRTSTKTNQSTRRVDKSNFALRYVDLCSLQNLNPSTVVKQHLDKGVLDFVGDRLKYEEWYTIFNALPYDQTLHFIGIRSRHPTKFPLENLDTELKVRSNNKQPAFKSKFVLSKLLDSLGQSVAQSRALTALELEGLPLAPDYMALLCRGVMESKTIQHLSFFKSYIQDEGTDMVCATIKNMPSVISLDLSYCGVTSLGADVIAALIKYQKLNRYSEAWKHSLRYRDPDVEAMPGLRRITLNGNSDIHDEGVLQLAEEMKDDLWIRAVDLQDCGLSDESGKMFIDLVQCNTNLVVVDIRGNPFVTQACVTDLMNQLNINNGNKQTEYQWISRSSSLNKKPFMVSSRPWSCVQPSEVSLNYPKMKRSHSTIVSRDVLALRKKDESNDFKLKLRMEEKSKMQEQMKDLTFIINQTRQKNDKLEEEIQNLTEENRDLKTQNQKLRQEYDKMQENLQLLEAVVSKCNVLYKDEDCNESSDNEQETEMLEMITGMQRLLEKVPKEEKSKETHHKEEARGIRFKTNLAKVEEENESWSSEENKNKDRKKRKNGMTRAQSLFDSFLGGDKKQKKNMRNYNCEKEKESDQCRCSSSSDSDSS